MERQNANVLFWDPHGLSVRRADRIICLNGRSNPRQYAWVADAMDMAGLSHDSYQGKFATARRGAGWILDTHGNRGRKIREDATAQGARQLRPARRENT